MVYIIYTGRSSKYEFFLSAFFEWKGTNFTFFEDPGMSQVGSFPQVFRWFLFEILFVAFSRTENRCFGGNPAKEIGSTNWEFDCNIWFVCSYFRCKTNQIKSNRSTTMSGFCCLENIESPGDWKWSFDSLVGGHFTFHRSIPKRSQKKSTFPQTASHKRLIWWSRRQHKGHPWQQFLHLTKIRNHSTSRKSTNECNLIFRDLINESCKLFFLKQSKSSKVEICRSEISLLTS